MKNTVKKVLMAAMVSAILVCTAAGCESKVETAEPLAQNSVVQRSAAEKETVATTEARTGSTSFQNGKISEDMIKYAYLSSDSEEKNSIFIKLDDHSQFGYGCFATVNDMESDIITDGKITDYIEKKNSDGSITASFNIVCDYIPSNESIALEVTEYADGTVKLTENGISYNMKKTTDIENMKKYMEEVSTKYCSKFEASDSETEAAILDNACKDYYAMLITGKLNNDDANGITADKLPDANISEGEKNAVIGRCTIKGALEYAGIASENFDFSKLAGSEDGSIGIKDSEHTKQISENTTLAELYMNN